MVHFNTINKDTKDIDYSKVYTFDVETKDKLKGSDLWKISLCGKDSVLVYDSVNEFLRKLLKLI